MFNFISLLAAHLIADYPLQGSFLAANKGHNSFILGVHSAIYASVLYLTMCALSGTNLDASACFVLFATHVMIDKIKCVLGKKNPEKALGLYLYIDQATHMLINVLVFILYI